jgi:hypothetical protein
MTHEATIFKNDDAGFRAWQTGHPQGFVLNRQKGKTDLYLILHRARCRQIATRSGNPHACTGMKYIKVCADSIEPLEAHAVEQGGPLTKCRICNP